MLKRLSISQFVIIDSMSVDFHDGLTVLTGETGAGKSILLDALGLILGDEPNRDAIRQGSSESVLEGHFDQPKDHPVWAFLAAQEGLDAKPGSALRIRRTIGLGDKDEILVNDHPLSPALLKTLGTFLVEIHGQFANQNFLAPETQLTLLDAFGAYPPNMLENVKKAWADVNETTRLLEEEKAFYATAGREKAGLQRMVDLIEKLELDAGDVEKMQAELARLIQARDVSDIFQSVNAQLIAQSGAELTLSRVQRTLEAQTDPALGPMKQAVKAALEQTRVAIGEMQTLAPKYLDVDTSGIRALEKKLEDIKAVATELKVTPEALYGRYEYLAERLERIINAPTKIRELDEALAKANGDYRNFAHALTAARMGSAQKLSAAINAEMPLLRLMSAQIKVEVIENPMKRTERGFNEVIFTARMNPGMPFSPIIETASGGELSRLILAIKMILQEVQSVSTLVFDEIDTGIGGAAAAAVGARIARLAETTQILVITHSPQVASRGEQHLHVSKQTDGVVTRSVVHTLTLDQRIDEVSRMLAGEQITDESQAAARTLIEEAAHAVQERKAARAATLAAALATPQAAPEASPEPPQNA